MSSCCFRNKSPTGRDCTEQPRATAEDGDFDACSGGVGACGLKMVSLFKAV